MPPETVADPSTAPTITAIVPTRDRPELLRRALASVARQRYDGPIEILVVFDQSEPALPDLELPDHVTMTALVNERTPGLGGARNTGAVAATGTFLCFCDDDDEWLPHKLERQVALARSDDGAIAVGGGIVVRSLGRDVVRTPDVDRVTLRDLLRSRWMELHSSNLLVGRDDFVERIGMIDEDLPGSQNEDYDWLLRATKLGHVAIVREPTAIIHWSGSWFAERWNTLVAAHTYLLERHPEFRTEPRGLARLYGQIAFYEAAAGRRGSARSWAFRTMRTMPREPRAYLALAVASGAIAAPRLVSLANRFGRGI